jgi:hypothetical protein
MSTLSDSRFKKVDFTDRGACAQSINCINTPIKRDTTIIVNQEPASTIETESIWHFHNLLLTTI